MGTLSAPTIESLVENVRDFLNQPEETNSFWSDDELIRYLNEGIRRYFAEVVLRLEGHFTTTTTLNLVANTESVALPSDCFAVKALYRTVSNGYQLLAPDNNTTEGYSTSAGGSGDGYLPNYRFQNNNLILRPLPGFSETSGLKIEYIQFPETMVTGGDSMTAQVSPVFKDLIEMYAVYKAKLKESLVIGTDTTALAKENLNDLFVAFKEAITDRSKFPVYTQPFNPESN